MIDETKGVVLLLFAVIVCNVKARKLYAIILSLLDTDAFLVCILCFLGRPLPLAITW